MIYIRIGALYANSLHGQLIRNFAKKPVFAMLPLTGLALPWCFSVSESVMAQEIAAPYQLTQFDEIDPATSSGLLKTAAAELTSVIDGFTHWSGDVEVAEQVRVNEEITVKVDRDNRQGTSQFEELANRSPGAVKRGVEDEWTIAAPLEFRRNFVGQFYFDAEHSSVRSSYHTTGLVQYTILNANLQFELDVPLVFSSVRLPEGTYTKTPGDFTPLLPLANATDRPSLIEKHQNAEQPTAFGGSYLFHPMVIFQLSNLRVDELTKRFAQDLTVPELAKIIEVKRNHEDRLLCVSRFFNRRSQERRVELQVFYDERNHFLPARAALIEDGRISLETIWKFGIQNGAPLPLEYRYSNRNSNNEITVRRVCRFVRSDPISTSAREIVTFDSLQAKDGDVLQDRATGQRLVMYHGNAIDPKSLAKQGGTLVSKNEGRSSLQWLIWMNVIAITAGSIYFLRGKGMKRFG